MTDESPFLPIKPATESDVPQVNVVDSSRRPLPKKSQPSCSTSSRSSSLSTSTSESNFCLLAFALAIAAILFSEEISDFVFSNDQTRILKHQSAQRAPNISSWAVVPMETRQERYRVIALRDIMPGELLVKEPPLVSVKLRSLTIQSANQEIEHIIQNLDGEDRNRFLALSNAWEHRQEQGVELNKYAGILRTNAVASRRNYVSVFASLARVNHACTGAVNAVYNWREHEKRLVLHSSRPIRAGEEILVSYFDSKLPRADRQSFLQDVYGFNCTCSVCLSDEHQSQESDLRITRINSLKASLGAWSAHSLTGAEAIDMIEDAMLMMRQEGMTYEFAQLYADASHIATAHSDFYNGRHYAKLAAEHFTIEMGPDSVEVAVANKLIKNPTSSVVWATRQQELVRPARQ